MNSYSWLIEATITSSVVAVIIFTIRLSLKDKLSGKLKYYLWVIFLLRLLVIPLPESKISIYNLLPQTNTFSKQITKDTTLNISSNLNNTNTSQNNNITSSNTNPINSNNYNNLNSKNNSNIENKTISIIKIVLWGYGFGVTVLLIISLVSYISFIFKFSKKAKKVSGIAEERLKIIKSRLKIKRNIELIYGDTPFIYGLFKVKLVIPKGVEEEELDAVLLHELMHYKYGDLLINWILIVLKAIYWFNPIVWLIFRQIRKDCEVACDERVLESKYIDRKSYATVLFKNALKGNRYLVGTSAFSKEGSDIKGRIKLIDKFKNRKTLWIVFGVVIFALVGIVSLTNSEKIVADVKLTDSEAKVIREYLNEKLNDDEKSVGEPYVAFKILGGTNTKIYLWALAMNGESGSAVPVLLNVDRVDGGLEILSYKVPRDGDLFPKDVRKLFPKDVQDEIFARDIEKYNKMMSELKSEIEEQINKDSIKLSEDSNIQENDIKILEINRLEDVKDQAQFEIRYDPDATGVEIKKTKITDKQSYGVDMVSLDYASDDFVIFHGYFGLFVYSLKDNKIIDSLDLEYIDCNATQGDGYCEVSIIDGLDRIQLHNNSSEYMYEYVVRAFSEEPKLYKVKYKPIEKVTALIPTPEEFKNSSNLTSTEAVKFKNGDVGYLVLTDGTINSLEYVRGDKRVKIFE